LSSLDFPKSGLFQCVFKMKLRALLVLALLALIGLEAAPVSEVQAKPARKPKLLLAIAIDQFRYDYTTRFRDQYTGGLARLLTQGAVYIDAHQDHFPTVTATGHAACFQAQSLSFAASSLMMALLQIGAPRREAGCALTVPVSWQVRRCI
jgi:hypothetical protein